VRECALFKILLYNICSNPWLLVLAFSFLFFIYLFSLCTSFWNMEEQQHPRPAPSISPCSFYVASTVEEEDRRQRHDCGDSEEEGAEPQGRGHKGVCFG
jgi:hypothetical protein